MGFSEHRFATADDALVAANSSLTHNFSAAPGKQLVADRAPDPSDAAIDDIKKRLAAIAKAAVAGG